MSWFSNESKTERLIRVLKSWTPGEPLPTSEFLELEDWFKKIDQISAGERELWQGILNAQPDPAVLMNTRGLIISSNRKFTESFGAEKRIEDCVRDPKVLESIESVRQGPAGSAIKVEIKLGERFYKLRVSRLQDYVYCVFQDQTDLKHAIEDRSQLLSDIAHELRTPLTAILGFAQTMQQDSSTISKEDHASYVEIIVRNAERLGVLVNEFLDLTRLESHAFKLSKEKVATELLLAQVLDQLRFAIEDKSIDIKIEITAKELTIDKGLFERALRNVIENAIKYSPAQSKIDISVQSLGANIRIEVKDEGPGIAPEFQERVFDRFFRVETSRSRDQKVGGSGLGLALVKRIIQAHGGSVGVDSVVGQGSTFWMELVGK